MKLKILLLLITFLSLSFIGLSKKAEISAADSVNLEKFSPNYTKNGDFEKKTIKQIIQEKISPESAKNVPPKDWDVYAKSESFQPKDIEFEISQQEEYQFAGKKSLFVKTNKSDIGLSQNFSKGVEFPSFVQANV